MVPPRAFFDGKWGRDCGGTAAGLRRETPALIHCGPFANIAHGCSSVVATRTALSLAEYVATEAGFGTELGAEKFFHIKCRQAGIFPSAAVLVVTCAALRRQGAASDDQLHRPDLAALTTGLENLEAHLENLTVFGVPVVVALNSFPGDSDAEVGAIWDLCDRLCAEFSASDAFARGGEGAVHLAEKVRRAADGRSPAPRFLYEPELPLVDKLRIVAQTLYRADDVELDDAALRDIDWLERFGFGHLSLCIAKTQYSLSDRKADLGAPRGWRLRVRSLRVAAGARFIVARTGNIVTMPGMTKHPGAERLYVDAQGRVQGLL